ncbi:hypothetical protein FOA52_013259 [Chlamydomonas sp. UWO 241]|nr:hypothetical protein FOA52_013259 [Chlamydomonas sp. UWO 241]
MSVAGGRIAASAGANLLGTQAHDRNQEATCYVGNLDPQVTEEVVWELFTQAGPVVNVYLPKDRVTNNHQGYGFVEFRAEEDADYAIKVLNMIKMHGKPIRCNKSASDKKTSDVGANLFIGNLDVDVDEKLLYDTFSAFGVIITTPKIMRDPDTGNSRGFGFVSYDCFEASDAAIEAMNGQFLCNRAISVGYAYKKDTKGERHGTPAERLLAAQTKANAAVQSRPHTLFATAPGGATDAGPPPPSGPVPLMGASGFAAGGYMPPPAQPQQPGLGFGAPPPQPGGGMPPPPRPPAMGMPPPPWGAPPNGGPPPHPHPHHPPPPHGHGGYGGPPPGGAPPPPWATGGGGGGAPPPPWAVGGGGGYPPGMPPPPRPGPGYPPGPPGV